eukprot:GHVP01024443.1.p1 GENE.GHVP01024443.1~~GHVP01024443.1.p1  ORF type:complete len:143 (+),score=25.57 GHVP01024443.1:33-431(+)
MPVVILKGRFAGKKGIVYKLFESTSARNYISALVYGVETHPKKAFVGMSENSIKKRSKIKVFAKVLNIVHLIPSSEEIDFDLSKQNEELKNGLESWDNELKNRKKTLARIKAAFQEEYGNGKSSWLFTKVNF